MKLYKLYKGDVFLKKGTLWELADYTKLHQGSLLNYSYPKYIEKNKGKDVLELYEVTDD